MSEWKRVSEFWQKKGRELLWRVHFDVTLSVNVFTSVHNYTPTKICCTVIIEVHYGIEYEDMFTMASDTTSNDSPLK